MKFERDITPLLTFAIFVLCCFVFVNYGCNRRSEPIKIGMSINLSGLGGAACEHIRDGALLAVEEVNNNGGINGRPLVLLVKDDENSEDGIRKADEYLVREGAVAVIGHSQSSNTLKAYSYLVSREILMITGYTATTKLSGNDDLFLRTSIDCNSYGKKTAALLAEKNVLSVSFLMDMGNEDFVLDYVDKVKKNYQGVITEVRINAHDNVAWDKVTTDLLANKPQAVIMLTESSMTAVAAQNLRSRSFAGNLIATIWSQSPELICTGGSATEGISIVSFIDPENRRPDYLEFSKKLQENFGKSANARSARAYEMIHLLSQGLSRCSKINAHELKAELLKGKFMSILGPVSFDRFGDVRRPVYEVVVKDGQFRNAGEII